MSSNNKYTEKIQYNSWGSEIDPAAFEQMDNACSLPISRAAALMPDAHVGYGLPIGGVLGTEDAVIPYAVGVDIACRVKLSILDIPFSKFDNDKDSFKKAIEKHSKFGIGAKWKDKKDHPVMDEDWGIAPFINKLKDKAWEQLGTSGSGNHFVEFGKLELFEECMGVPKGDYLALVSHSGSRGAGAQIAGYYSRLAQECCSDLPKKLRHLSWLKLGAGGAGEGDEYWSAMELMGRYASANHYLIHRDILEWLGSEKLLQVENHHNFAWKEEHGGKELVVHRKGATPAGKGVLGYIPGSMTAPGYLVEGLGEEASLSSASHGAGRRMSRKMAKSVVSHKELEKALNDHGVELISAGLDEAPHAYKDIAQVMEAQNDLARKVAKFQPKLVKMAPAGERPED